MSPDDIATKEDTAAIKQSIAELKTLVCNLQSALSSAKGETYLTYQEVMADYKISKGQITALRNEGILPYTDEFGVYLHPKSEIEKILQDSMKNKHSRANEILFPTQKTKKQKSSQRDLFLV